MQGMERSEQIVMQPWSLSDAVIALTVLPSAVLIISSLDVFATLNNHEFRSIIWMVATSLMRLSLFVIVEIEMEMELTDGRDRALTGEPHHGSCPAIASLSLGKHSGSIS
jgi:hypothetical protein